MTSPLILAHRGASAAAPENTISAFLLARELGADGVELDVTLTRDRVPVVIHDDSVERTTNGRGRVNDMTLDEIKRLDAGSWKGDEFRGERIPTLGETLVALAEWIHPAKTAHGALVNIELKSRGFRTDGVEEEVIAEVNQRGLADSVLISSFNPIALIRVRLASPRTSRGLLYDQSLPIHLRRAWLRTLAAPQALHPHYPMIDERFMRWALSRHYQINTWTVDVHEDALRLAGLGVNAIITNRPDIIRRALLAAAS